MFDERAFPPSEVNVGQLVADLIRKENRDCLEERFKIATTIAFTTRL